MKGKGKGKEQSKDKGQDKTDQAQMPSPFAVMSNTADSAVVTPFPQQSTSTTPLPETGGMANSELMLAIRRAFPDSQSMPSELRDVVEKTENVATKVLTQELHRATTSMGKAQKNHKELQDAKERHRLQWLQHMESSLKIWQQQMEDYDKKQLDFVEAIQKAKKDMEAAHFLIQTLNAKAAGKPPSQVTNEAIEVDGPDDLSHICDKEERKLRKSLQQLLAACATKTGTMIAPEFVIASDDEKNEDEKGGTKRPRSLPPEPTLTGQKPAAPALSGSS